MTRDTMIYVSSINYIVIFQIINNVGIHKHYHLVRIIENNQKLFQSSTEV